VVTSPEHSLDAIIFMSKDMFSGDDVYLLASPMDPIRSPKVAQTSDYYLTGPLSNDLFDHISDLLSATSFYLLPGSNAATGSINCILACLSQSEVLWGSVRGRS
jgi:hypothetical protein